MGSTTQDAVAITPLITLDRSVRAYESDAEIDAASAHLLVRNNQPAVVATIPALRELLARLGAEPAWIEAKIHYAETGVWLYSGLA